MEKLTTMISSWNLRRLVTQIDGPLDNKNWPLDISSNLVNQQSVY